MPFKRNWDSTCPRVWTSWEDQGVKWTIEDLPPEEDELALKVLVEQFLNDEILCSMAAGTGVSNDPTSVQSSKDFWRKALAQRTSLACYCWAGGKTLAALNVCPVAEPDQQYDVEMYKGKAWREVIGVLIYVEDKIDMQKALTAGPYLSGAGLMVLREYRGKGLGTKLLKAREHLCRHLGLAATATVFTGPASQKSAAAAGFHDLLAVPWTELARAGFTYPSEDRVLKLMARKYDF